jgi:ribA/ribD-fused uncharacterized protein
MNPKVDLIPKDPNKVNLFMGEYRFLSNFHLFPVEYDGLVFPSTEHAYQAAKTNSLVEREKFLTMTCGEAKRYGGVISRTPELFRPDWHDISLQVMEQVCTEKFSLSEDCRMGLLGTGDKYLCESNWWCDNFYGRCYCGGNSAKNCPGNGTGKNHLGHIFNGDSVQALCRANMTDTSLLWLDDVRPAPPKWTWVKTVKEAIAHMESHDVEYASLDHDLGAEPTGNIKDIYLQGMSLDGSGYDFVKWMCENEKFPTKRIVIHSWNPDGAKAMAEKTPGTLRHACIRVSV